MQIILGGDYLINFLVAIHLLSFHLLHFLGGLVGGVLVGAPLASLRYVGGSADSFVWKIWSSVIIAIFVVLASLLGKFLLNYVKKVHGVKDSGKILFGQGGVLDQVVGVLMVPLSTVLAFLFIQLF